MGNEMGNNSTSGLKEEGNTTVEDPKDVLKDNVKEENHVAVTAAEDKDFHEKVDGLDSGDLPVDKQKLSKLKVQEESVFSLDDSLPKVKAESNEEGDESSQNQICLSNSTEDESVLETKLEKIVPETSENQLPRQASVRKAEEGTRNLAFDKISTTPHDPEPEKPAFSESVQQELAIIHDEPSLPDANGSSDGTKQALGSRLMLSDTEVTENLEESVDAELNTMIGIKMDEPLVEQEAVKEEIENFCEEKYEVEDEGKFENELSNATPESSDLSGPSEKSDEGFPTEVSITRDFCSESETKPDKEAPELARKSMAVAEENRLELENGEYKHDKNSSKPCEEMVKESDTEDPGAFQLESIAVDQKDAVNPSSHEVKISHINNQNWVSEDNLKDSEANAFISSQLGIIPSESNIADCSHKEESSKEKRIVGEENMESLYAIEIDTEETKTGEEDSLPVDNQQESVLKSEIVPSENESIQEPKKDSYGEFLTAQASTFDSTNLIAEIIVSMNEMAVENSKQDVKECIEKSKISSKSETSASARESVERLSMGSMERFSTDSEHDNTSVQYDQMRKSPSFSLDLQNEAKNDESDRTPLLYQDKAEIQSSPSQDEISLGTPLTVNGYSTQDQAMPLEEKVVTLERSDSDKSKSPFLGFLKEEEEAHIVVTPQKQKETKDLWRSSSTKKATSSASTKGKEKRKARSYLFGNCMCCATVIN
ncbi:hypothetical protein L484_013346 [Morus notabilis]|uniref:Uncharacterized protein n=1 Tax=Morus notabilis TaxID=981085 RepID=W9RXU0_9ROSA|nr:hypothetical protein L484_013346 [Morus notabilis]